MNEVFKFLLAKLWPACLEFVACIDVAFGAWHKMIFCLYYASLTEGMKIWGRGGGTVLSFGRSLAKNCGGLGLSETMSKSIFGPNLIIFWYLE